MSKKKREVLIYRGKLVKTGNGEADDLLGLEKQPGDPIILAEQIMEDLDQYASQSPVTVHYFVTAKPCTEEQLTTELANVAFGEATADYCMRYSEVTGYLWTDEELTIGGHDLLWELGEAVGSYLHLEIRPVYDLPAELDPTALPVEYRLEKTGTLAKIYVRARLDTFLARGSTLPFPGFFKQGHSDLEAEKAKQRGEREGLRLREQQSDRDDEAGWVVAHPGEGVWEANWHRLQDWLEWNFSALLRVALRWSRSTRR